MVETDTYVIIPIGTPFHNLVQAALYRLGYSSESAAAAKGSVLIKNWKALNFDQISDDPLVTVGDILGELSTVATLRIQVFRGKPGSLNDIKDKLLRYLLLQSHGILLSSGCPLDEVRMIFIGRFLLENNYYSPERMLDQKISNSAIYLKYFCRLLINSYFMIIFAKLLLKKLRD